MEKALVDLEKVTLKELSMAWANEAKPKLLEGGLVFEGILGVVTVLACFSEVVFNKTF